MTEAVLTLAVLDFVLVCVLPRIFFRSDGKFNFRWWLTASPFVAVPTVLVLGYLGHLAPLTTEGSQWREVVSVVLFSASIGLMCLTMGTNRVPLALWHQENDAPVNIMTFGAYRFIRHPFYTSFIIAMTGAVVLFPHPLTIFFALYQVTALNLTAAREERRLSASPFGKEYQDYMARTGRFTPKLGA